MIIASVKKGEYLMHIPIIFGYSLLTALTAVYCVLLWYGAGLWGVLYSPSEFGSLPLFSLLCIAPLPLPLLWQMIHWQFLAILSLFICIRWGVQRARSAKNDVDISLPMVMHILWIFFAPTKIDRLDHHGDSRSQRIRPCTARKCG